MTLSEEFQYPAPCLPVSVKRIFKLTCATLFALLVVYLAALSAYSHHQVDSMHMAELVAQHREEWIANHNARELKRQIDANNLWGKPSDVLKMTIYTPEAYERAAKMHQDEVDPK